MVITDDGTTLIVGESMDGHLTAFTVADDGSLVDRRDFAQLPGSVPDGICLDAEGAVWAACPFTGRCLRVRGGRRGSRRGEDDLRLGVRVHARRRRSSHAVHLHRARSRARRGAAARGGRIESVEVDVPGAGLP